MYKGKTVSVVIPCYNEEDGLRMLMKFIPKFVDEIIVVDNNSTDATAQVARLFGAKVVREREKGYGRAYKAGFREAKSDIVITTDGDATYPIRYCYRSLDKLLEDDLDFISCRRFPLMIKEAMRKRNIIGNKILTFFTNMLFGLRLYDSQSGMWIFRRDVLSKIELISNGMSFSEEIKIEVFTNRGIRTEEVPIIYQERVGHTKLFAWRDGIENLLFLFRKRFRTRI